MIDLSQGIAPVKPSASLVANMTLPDGRKVGDVLSGGALATVLLDAGVEGVSHEKGRAENVAAYAAYLDKIFDEAGKRAVAEWMKDQS